MTLGDFQGMTSAVWYIVIRSFFEHIRGAIFVMMH